MKTSSEFQTSSQTWVHIPTSHPSEWLNVLLYMLFLHVKRDPQVFYALWQSKVIYEDFLRISQGEWSSLASYANGFRSVDGDRPPRARRGASFLWPRSVRRGRWRGGWARPPRVCPKFRSRPRPQLVFGLRSLQSGAGVRAAWLNWRRTGMGVRDGRECGLGPIEKGSDFFFFGSCSKKSCYIWHFLQTLRSCELLLYF